MQKKFTFLLLILTTIYVQVNAQKDTLAGSSDDVFVTATRSERKLSNIAVPAIIVNKKTIQQTGSLKLQDVLQEQTGIVVVNSNLATSLNGYPNPFGQGVQMLGLDPAYTAILMDGEPLVGRNAGILKLGRIATGNIRQIEIVKGPSSSLYGSEAMAGVINILTANPTNETLDAQLHTASNNTFAGTISYANKFNKTGVQIFLNRYSTQGYDLDTKTYGKTVDPYRDVTANVKITQDINAKTQLLISLRGFDSKQDNNYQIYQSGIPGIVKGYTTENDNNIFTQLKYAASASTKWYFRTFYNHYANNSFVNLENTDTRFDETTFSQSILKPEVQFEHAKNKQSRYVAGIGAYFETIDASRYSGKQTLSTFYTFSQKEWYLLKQKITIVAGGRLDKRTDFNLNISPRIAIAYKPNTHWKFTASAGSGFKAPDFRHMYLNFFNAQIGYSLIGQSVLAQELTKMQQQGALQSGSNINPYLNNTQLLPEKSFGTHIGAKFTKDKWSIETGIFRNDINNLIDVYLLPFNKTNGSNIYSYRNINRTFTQGIELDIKYKLIKNITISAGYQYLEAKDKDILNQIKAETIYKRDPVTYQTTLVSKADYFGINNRSKHILNTKILWSNEVSGFDAYLRLVYRGKYGFTDINGNSIADDDREMVQGYWLTNIAIAKSINQKIQLQAGIENIFNYTNVQQMPNIAGRLFFFNLNYSFNHINNHKK
jgi:outer membrane receptor for ferrienterochelin and colicins